MRIKFYLSVLILIFSIKNVNAQPRIDFSGYLQNYSIYQFIPRKLSEFYGTDKTLFTNLFRIRLKPVLFLWRGGRINLDYELNMNYVSQNFPLLNFTLQNNRRTLKELSWNPIDEEKIKIRHFIDRLYFRQKLPFGDVKIGRQRISWGTGRIWNPTDLFNPINPAAYYIIEKPGADAISTKIRFGNFTDLNLVYNPVNDFKEYNFAARFRTNFFEYDFSLMAGKFDNKTVVGFDFAGNISDAGFRGEAIYSIDPENSENDFFRFVAGLDYQFTPKLYLLIEYQFNGEGKTDKYQYQLLRLLNGEIQNLNRNYIAVSGMYQLTPLFLLNGISIINLNDASGFVSLSGNYSVTENFYMNLGIQIFSGDTFTEYWYFPDSVYLQGEYYF